MIPNRRRFLSLLGIGAASAPLAARVAAEQEMRSLTSLAGGPLSRSFSADGFGVPAATQSGGQIQTSPYVMAQRYIKLWGQLPAFVEDNIRERAKMINCLDPDIACKKSWSLNVKIAAQRERNYKKEIERYTKTGNYETAQDAFSKITGFNWPW